MSQSASMKDDESIVSDESSRRSFRNHQTLRRQCPKSFIFVAAVVALFLLQNIFIKSPLQIAEAPKFQVNKNQEISTASNNKGLQNFTKIYLNSYCEQNKHLCKEQNIDALNTILLLMHSQTTSTKSRPKAYESNQQQLQYGNYINQYKINASNIEKIPFQGKLKEYQYVSKQTSMIEVTLSIIKHSKVTTPKQISFINSIFSVFKSADIYQGIDSLVSKEDSNIVWGVGKNMLISVQSKNQFSPHLFQIILKTQTQISVQIKGLTINIEQKVFITDLGSYQCKDHLNSFRCSTQQCSQKYQAIIFKFPESQVQKIRIYQIIQW